MKIFLSSTVEEMRRALKIEKKSSAFLVILLLELEQRSVLERQQTPFPHRLRHLSRQRGTGVPESLSSERIKYLSRWDQAGWRRTFGKENNKQAV